MARANDAEKAERLNHARGLLQRFDSLPEAVEKMVRDCSFLHVKPTDISDKQDD